MQTVNYISNLAMPMIILIIVVYGVKEKTKVFDNFLVGAKEGIETTLKIFPTLIGLFVAIGALRSSGILDLIVNLANPVLEFISFPSELMPLALLRPISGSSSVAVATDIMKNLGVDSLILSGPAVLPVAVRMVWEVSQAVDLPILGMGGVSRGEDAAQLMLAGASAVAVGTALFTDPFAPLKVRDGLAEIAEKQGFSAVKELTGGVKPW